MNSHFLWHVSFLRTDIANVKVEIWPQMIFDYLHSKNRLTLMICAPSLAAGAFVTYLLSFRQQSPVGAKLSGAETCSPTTLHLVP